MKQSQKKQTTTKNIPSTKTIPKQTTSNIQIIKQSYKQFHQLPHNLLSHTICTSIIETVIIKKLYQKISDHELVNNKLNQYTGLELLGLITDVNQQLHNQCAMAVKEGDKHNQVIYYSDKKQQRNFKEDKEAMKAIFDNLMQLQSIQYVENAGKEQKEIQQQQNMIKLKSKNKSMKKLQIKESKSSSNYSSIKNISDRKKIQQKLYKLQHTNNQIDTNIDAYRQQIIKKQQQQKNTLKNNEGTNKNQPKISRQQINYGYSGQVIKVKVQNKQNLVHNKVSGNLIDQKNKKQDMILRKKSYTKKNNGTISKKTQYVQTKPVVDSDEKSRILSKRKSTLKINNEKAKEKEKIQKIQFSYINNPLGNIEIKEGVKAVFEKDVITLNRLKTQDQNNGNRLDVDQLRKSLKTNSNRKLSRNQYRKLKESQQIAQTEFQKQRRKTQYVQKSTKIIDSGNPLDQKPKIEPILIKKAKQSNEKIKLIINDQSFRESILIGNQDQFNKKTLENLDKKINQKQQREELNHIDKYNLQYAKNSQAISNNINKVGKQKINQGKSVQLPKISTSNKTNTSNVTAYPKIRERVRQNSSIRKQFKKKFQENLRV